MGENDKSENDGFKIVVPENMVEKGNVDEVITGREDKIDRNKVIIEFIENKTKQDHSGNIVSRTHPLTSLLH